MRNRYPGTCYRCGKTVAAYEGHFERSPVAGEKWRLQHASCAIENRGKPDAARAAHTAAMHQRRLDKWREQAKGTGRTAQRARRKLKDRDIDF